MRMKPNSSAAPVTYNKKEGEYSLYGWFRVIYDAGNDDYSVNLINSSNNYVYALYVPYASGDLTIMHSKKADSAGTCADDGLQLKYNGTPYTGNSTTPAQLTVHVDEGQLSTQISVTVDAKAATPGQYVATYYNNAQEIGVKPDGSDYYEHTYNFTVGQLLTASDTVKGLYIRNPVNFYSEFSLGYTIT